MTNPISETAAWVLEDTAPLRKRRLELLPKNIAADAVTDAAMALVRLSLWNCFLSSSSSFSYLLFSENELHWIEASGFGAPSVMGLTYPLGSSLYSVD